MAPNYSLFSIPAYLILAMAPHMYAVNLLTSQPNSKSKSKSSSSSSSIYNVSNPRSSQNSQKYASTLPPSVYARYERARAAHTNMFENSAFFISAVLAGIVAKCDPGFMNRVSGLFLLTRVAYIFSYVGVEKGAWAYLRTLWFTAGYACLFSLWWNAGNRIMLGNY